MTVGHRLLQSFWATEAIFQYGIRIPGTNQDGRIKVHFPGWDDHQNSQKCGDEAI
jgi:hypothetical protein